MKASRPPVHYHWLHDHFPMRNRGGRRVTGGESARLVDEVTAGPSGAMTREGVTLTGTLTVVTTALPAKRAQVTVQEVGATEWHTLAGSPFPVPPEGIEALHTIVVAAIGAGSRPPG
ncbi:hypothetical protein ABZ746_26785 [Streptomyces sp. NPDC020096]|jgi:hypothetical protein